ncbi:MAG: PhoH family protein [Lachnospiraceae bacterium]|nr:PhoH family protein [Lachnospiraceae bacterium]
MKYTRELDVPLDRMQELFGTGDSYIKKIEEGMEVTVTDRNGSLNVGGENEQKVEHAVHLINQLVNVSKRGTALEAQSIDYAVELGKDGLEDNIEEIDREVICRAVNGRPVKAKTLGQKDYARAMKEHMITFGIGPAGTGKTYLAIAMAVNAFRTEEVSRIILTRPAMEAGEKLGFLPGDLQSKVDPYLRPLYDALFQIMGPEDFSRNLERGLIEVAPLAYMRGRTLDRSFIILDEAQNTTPSQMKMFLTRIGFGSKAVITGDLTQKDLPGDMPSGLDSAKRVLAKIPEIKFCTLTSKDVVRHPLVQKIVRAYEDYENREKSGSGRKGH